MRKPRGRTMGKKTRTKRDQQIHDLEDTLNNNLLAITEGPTRKKRWSIHDLKQIKPLTYAQELMMRGYIEGNHIIASGSAGTGKTLVALYLALNDILSKETPRNKMVIVRSIVPTRDMGFLKGTEEEKMEPYEAPYVDIFNFLLGKNNSYENMKEANLIKFAPTSFLRGVTWDNAVIILDESQNYNWEEINTCLTRVGDNSQIITIGDTKQNDLYRSKYDTSGFDKFLAISANMKSFDHVQFTRSDIVRSPFVKEWICAVEDYQD